MKTGRKILTGLRIIGILSIEIIVINLAKNLYQFIDTHGLLTDQVNILTHSVTIPQPIIALEAATVFFASIFIITEMIDISKLFIDPEKDKEETKLIDLPGANAQ